MSEVIRCLLWFCFASLCDWLKNLAPLSRPIRSKTQTNRDLLARVFPCLAQLHVIASSSDWFIGEFEFVVIGWGNYVGLVLRHSFEKRSIIIYYLSSEKYCITQERKKNFTCNSMC